MSWLPAAAAPTMQSPSVIASLRQHQLEATMHNIQHHQFVLASTGPNTIGIQIVDIGRRSTSALDIPSALFTSRNCHHKAVAPCLSTVSISAMGSSTARNIAIHEPCSPAAAANCRAVHPHSSCLHTNIEIVLLPPVSFAYEIRLCTATV